MIRRVVKDMCDVVLSDEAYTYDAAGNVTDAPNSCFLYDTNNRIECQKPKRIPAGSWYLKNKSQLSNLDDTLGSASKLTKGLAKAGKVLEIGGYVVDGVVIILDTASGVVDNIDAGTRTQKIISDAYVDIQFGIAITGYTTAAGAIVGSFIPIPVLGTVSGIAAGYLVGKGVSWLVNEDLKILGDKSVVDWAKDGAAATADWLVEDLPDIVADVSDATADFVDDAGEWISDTAGDVWEATTNFVENTSEAVGDFLGNAGDAVGGLFNRLFA